MKGETMFAGSMQGSHRVLTLIVALAAAAFAVALVVLPSDRADALVAGSLAPTISSDQADYPPGGTVVLTGSNWQPGESVNIVVDDDGVDERDWQRDVTVAADENGNIRDEFQLPNWFVANYTVKATGTQSGVATTSFTDAVAKIEGKDKGGVNYRSAGGPLNGWDELEKIPMRLAFTNAGSQTVIVTFDHVSNSGRRIPGIKDLVDWTGNSSVTSLNAQLTDTSGEEWAYTVVANLASGTNNSNPGYVEFKAILAAGSHDYPGGSLHVNLGGDGNGTMQINPSDVIAANPDLVVDKTGPATAEPGSTIEYKIYYKNISTTDAATGAALEDVLPSDVTFDSCSDSCTVAGNEVTWVIGNLAPGAGSDPNNQLFRTRRVKIPANAANGTSYVNNTDFLSADAEQDLNNCGAVDSDNNADNDNAACDNYDSLKTTVAANRSPNAVNDTYSVNEDQTLTVPDGSTDVLSNDSDPDGDSLSATVNTQPSNGTLNLNSNGSFTYTPGANFNGTDSFKYTVSDGKGGTATGTVTITVNPVNDKPVAVNDSYSVDEDATLTRNAAGGVLGNDTDIEGSGLTAILVSGPVHGTLTVNPDGSFTYTPDANYSGLDTFTYKANDGNDDSNVATVSITVNPANDAPVIDKVEYGNPTQGGGVDGGPVDEGSPATIKITASDPDTPASELRYSFDCNDDIDDPSGDGYEVGPQPENSARCTYPDNGIYPVNVKVTDGAGGSDEDSINVLVRNVDPRADFDAAPNS
ncbi:MAG TPA: tandem-95 repeat protein, partial [Rubrobacter sp.]|nr:tandem-95 repeat protein [Rubrobacter sp.]